VIAKSKGKLVAKAAPPGGAIRFKNAKQRGRELARESPVPREKQAFSNKSDKSEAGWP